MLVSTLKPKEEILGYLRDGERVFLVACGGCAEVCEAGGEKALEELRSVLEASGHPVVGGKVLPFLCNKALVGIGLSRVSAKVEEAEALLVAACGVGVQTVAAVLEKPVFPASNTLTYGAFQGVWPSEERCARCGECILAYTGGICPLTVCPKGLLHGPCGGSYRGECEVERGRPCGWQRIYDRLEKIGRLDLFVRFKPPKDRQKELDVPLSRRKSIFWALEYIEEEE
jgi:ferredoxin